VRKDKRSLFVVPWGPRGDGTFAHTYIGTTDTDYDGPLDDPPCTDDDIEYVLRAVNDAVTTNITVDDITGAWAGLRPLVKSATSGRTADLSRRHRVTVGPAGVVAITGGKLTTYREMAEDTVDRVLDQLDARRRRCRTKRLRLLGAEGYHPPPEGTPAAHLGGRYGTLSGEVEALVAADPSLGAPLLPGLPYLRAEAVYAARHEMATTLTDVLLRRTRAHLFDRPLAVEQAPAIAAVLAAELGWDDAEAERQVADYRELAAAEEADARPAPAAT
jgi:glycerol-3-phosphate dehydrogenase